ncbi:MAG: ABC transporter ATP-binding protein [Anaerolineae bacterium]|nr:ABC transporter ATP-binding protein [Anaerolineae bacterium]MDW8173510.1 ABC transporter ATP-binding protein [Anaerolineae bacterium]
MSEVILSVRNLSVSYLARRGRVRAVSNVSFELHAGETLAFIGESGCGKSTLNLALIRTLPKTGQIDSGTMIYTRRDGQQIDVLKLNKQEHRRWLWSECSMVFQGALNSLNPVIRISDMIYDTAAAHGIPREDARKQALDLLEKVRLDPQRVFNSYPHELSGGMRQRVLLAISLLLRPQIVIMDEPTTAVDILTQRSILDVLKELRRELNFSVLFISHDLAVAAEIADRIATMYAGEIVEIGPVEEIFYRPRHAYTLALLDAAPRLSAGAEELHSIPGSPPDLIMPPPGCKFHERCAFAVASCHTTPPPLRPTHDAACHLVACTESERVLAAQRKIMRQ